MAYVQSYLLSGQQREIKGQNILYVIAHPDDEAMFFVPSILHLRQNNNLYLLCLSNGGYDGLGRIREKELEMSGRHLGFTENICVNDDDLQDGMANTWPEGVIADKVHRFLRSHSNKTFETIVTFDDRGVSAHPNHISVHQGVLRVLMLKQMHVRQVLALRTNMLVRKYMSYADILCMNSFDLNFCAFNPFICWAALSVHQS